VAEEGEASKPKRRLKRAAPETVRERAAKAVEANGKKIKPAREPRKVFAPFRAIGRFLKKVGSFPPIRILGLILLPRYVRNSWRELRQVAWPGRRESLRLTSAVIIFAVIFGVLIAATDYGLDKVFKKVILKQ
jgi:preprotein translocase SecE subunit